MLPEWVHLDCPAISLSHRDAALLRQLALILLDNAIKFTPTGGAVTIEARVLEEDYRYLVVDVSDTGCGIKAHETEEIFQRLYQVSERTQTSRKGLGLGLYICRELVVRQGGQIRAIRRAPIGTTFSFTLPVFSSSSSIATSPHNGLGEVIESPILPTAA